MHSSCIQSQWSVYLDKAAICQHPLSLGTPGRGVMTGAVESVTNVTRMMTRLRVVTTARVVTRRVVTVIRQILQPVEQNLENIFISVSL